jgi:hypothetical protein
MSIALFPPENESAVNKRQPLLYARHQIHRGRKEPSVQSLKTSLEVYFRQIWHSNQRYPASAIRFLARFSQCPHNRLADGELMAAILTLTNTHEHHQLPRLTSLNTPSQSVHLEREINRRWKMEIEMEGFGVETGTRKQDRGNKISTWEKEKEIEPNQTKPGTPGHPSTSSPMHPHAHPHPMTERRGPSKIPPRTERSFPHIIRINPHLFSLLIRSTHIVK